MKLATERQKVNYKSDFDFVARLMVTAPDGTTTDIGFPSYDWELRIYSGCNGYTQFVASAKGGKLTNCMNDNGQLRIVCDNHGLRVGKLFAEFYAYLPNDIYPDGEQLVVNPQEIGIELVADAGDEPTDIEIQLALPFIYDSAYRQAVSAGYKGTQNEYMALASMLPNAVETAIKIQGSADSLANSAETIGSAIETLGATTDAIEQGANVIKNNADTLQESATIVKTSAEQIGANIADLQASVQSIDDAVEGINQGASTIANSATKVEASATTLEGVSATISGSATSLSESATAIAEGANTIKNSADALQEGADKVGESAIAVEQAVEPLVQASESLDATKQAFEMLSSEWADGRQAIATALTNRRYPTEPTESFHAMAQKITDMNYEEGWFAKLGYDANDFGGILDAINFTLELSQAWNPDGSTSSLFYQKKSLVFFPKVDYTNAPMNNAFNGCSSLVNVLDIDAPNATNWGGVFSSCSSLFSVGAINSPMATSLFGTFNGCLNLRKIKSLDFASATNCTNVVMACSLLAYALFLNLGKPKITAYNFADATVWGTGSEENRQSLIDSLITYSYDRASAGMTTCTITLSANTKALLTDEEIAQITAKGFSLA